MATVLILSLVLHAILVALAYLNVGPAMVPPPQEPVAVEIVHDIPKPMALKPALPEGPAPQEAAAEAPPPVPAKEMAKPEAEKSDPKPPEVAKPPEEQKPQEAQKPPEAPKPPAPQKEAEDEGTLKSLESEVAALKAEQAALEAERVAPAEPAAAAVASAAPGPVGMGPLPDSFRAIALPATSDGVGEAVGYQQIVFSQLAKANEIGKIQGMPGSSGVHFDVDDAGGLISAEIVAPSGVPSLDAMALTIVRKAAPFPPPPQGAQRSFTANVTFVGEGAR